MCPWGKEKRGEPNYWTPLGKTKQGTGDGRHAIHKRRQREQHTKMPTHAKGEPPGGPSPCTAPAPPESHAASIVKMTTKLWYSKNPTVRTLSKSFQKCSKRRGSKHAPPTASNFGPGVVTPPEWQAAQSKPSDFVTMPEKKAKTVHRKIPIRGSDRSQSRAS